MCSAIETWWRYTNNGDRGPGTGDRFRRAEGVRGMIGRMTRVILIGVVASIAGHAGVSVSAPRGFVAQDDPVALVRAFLGTSNVAERAALSARVAAHPDYRPSRLREWLHRAAEYPALAPGVEALTVDAGAGERRRVFLVIPDGYRPDRSWPLVYALHPSGEPPDRWADQMRQMLGARAREYVIASPEYKQNYIAAIPPFVPEHPAILDAVARRVHVDADRVYAFGYSRGGFGAWYVALYHPDRLAGAVALAAGFDVAPGPDGFSRALVANVRHVPVLNAWGERDPLIVKDLVEQPAGTFAESNRYFQREVAGMGLPITNIEVPGGVHNQLAPPPGPVRDALRSRRTHDPSRIDHTFRHLFQASCYWLEGLSWVGDAWGAADPVVPPAQEGETAARALARTLEPLLGRLTGELDGQTIRVTRRHVGAVVVWFGEDTIDWDRAVTVELDGRHVFRGRIARDVGVALARAAVTRDFEALRFAGLHVDECGHATFVSAAALPDPVWQRTR